MTRFIISKELMKESSGFNIEMASKEEFERDKMAVRIIRDYYHDEDDEDEEDIYFDLKIDTTEIKNSELSGLSYGYIEYVEIYIIDGKVKIVCYYNPNYYVTHIIESATIRIDFINGEINIKLLSGDNFDYNK